LFGLGLMGMMLLILIAERLCRADVELRTGI